MVKIINGIEEVLILLFTAFRYEYLFWKYRLTRFKTEVIYSGKDSNCRKDTRQKEGGHPKLCSEKNVNETV